MRKSRVFRWVFVLLLMLALVAAIGGGVVYATSRGGKSAQGALEDGIVISSVVADGPAAGAGVVRGDILIELNGEKVDNAGALQQVLHNLEIGAEVELTVLHGDDLRTLTATVGERDGRPFLGLAPCGGPGLMPPVDIAPLRPGAAIAKVLPDSPAEQAGLQERDVIVAVDDKSVDAENDLAVLIAAFAPGDPVTLQVRRPGEDDPLQIEVTLGQHPDDASMAYLGVSYKRQPRVEWSPGAFSLPDHLPLPRLFEGQRFTLPMPGALVQSVEEDSAAAEVGLQEGDIIVQVDGESVEILQDLIDLIGARAPGDAVTLKLHRIDEDQPLEVEVTLGEHPEDPSRAYLGVRLAPVPHLGDLEEFTLPSPDVAFQQGAIIRDVAQDSPAADAGLESGDVITAIDGKAVVGPQALAETMAERDPGDTVTLTVFRHETEKEQDIEITLSAHPDDAEMAYLGVAIGGFFWRGDFEGELELPKGLFEGMPFHRGVMPERFFERGPFGRPEMPHRLPFGGEPGRFEFRFPPGFFEPEAPCCTEESTL